jgi:predicted PurR-regulated permease PerM
MGESVGLPPLVVILALFAGGQLFGLLGIFLAIPAAAVVRVLARHSYQWVIGR